MVLFADIIINRKTPAVDRVFTYNIPEQMSDSVQVGMLVHVPFNREKLEGVVVRLHDQKPDFATRDIIDIIGDRPLFSEQLLALSRWMAEYYHCSWATAMQAMLPAGMNLSGKKPRAIYHDYYSLADGYQQVRKSAKREKLIALLLDQGELDAVSLRQYGFDTAFLRAARQAGLIEKVSRSVADADYPLVPAGFNAEQEAVYNSINAERKAANRPYLLHGVTGSGKTEIYLRLIDDAAQRGQQSILLVPEIALSAQMVEMLSRRLDLPMALLHSGLLQSERRRIWQEIAEGKISVVIGARSAVFAPTPNLGLIIIDEEHETSYKQENNPRFHAVTTAAKRAELSGAQLVLGSATPSVESYFKATCGQYALGTLLRQYYPAPEPEVRIVDMREELKHGHKLIFSRELLTDLEQTLENHGQALLFLNRRGYYSFVSCRDCGQSLTCPHCAVALSFHDNGHGGWLKCHYCGYMIKPPEVCPSCGSKHIRRFGIGTQRVADEAKRLFPAARVARLDSDVMQKRGEYQRIYEAMRGGEIDILVGTQMVAKGLDFPNLHLAAVIAADTMLNLPDWRAGERTFQLISQLIGRAGRRNKQGLAVVQTYMPEAFPIVTAAERDYQRFYQAELLYRQMHGYPPCNHLLRLLFTARDQGALVEACQSYHYYLQQQLADAGEICGPAEAPYARIKDRWRRQIMIKTTDVHFSAQAAETAWQTMQQEEHLPPDIMFSIDIDPMSAF